MIIGTHTFNPPNPQDYLLGSTVSVISCGDDGFPHTTIRVEHVKRGGNVSGSILAYHPIVKYTIYGRDKK